MLQGTDACLIWTTWLACPAPYTPPQGLATVPLERLSVMVASAAENTGTRMYPITSAELHPLRVTLCMAPAVMHAVAISH